MREFGVDLGADRWAGLLGSTARATSASDLGGRSVLGPTERELGVRSTGFERLQGRASSVGVSKGVGFGFPAGLLVLMDSERERAASVSARASDFWSVGEGTVERGRFGKWEKF